VAVQSGAAQQLELALQLGKVNPVEAAAQDLVKLPAFLGPQNGRNRL